MSVSQDSTNITASYRADGYFNATALTTAYRQSTGIRRDTANWLLNKQTQDLLIVLSEDLNISITQLYEVFQGAIPTNQGTWLHPKLLDNFLAYLYRGANQQPKFLYVIGDKQRNVCKIGISANPYERLKTLQTGYPWQLDIWLELQIENPAKVEKILHTRFAEFRLNGEWFDACVFKHLNLNELTSVNESY